VEALPFEEGFGTIVLLDFVCRPFADQGAKGEEGYP
jgi:hypothetical protein